MLITLRLWLTSLKEAWWARQRATDLQILWPACKEQAVLFAPANADRIEILDFARAAFATHAFQDACWIDYYGEEKLVEYIGNLT